MQKKAKKQNAYNQMTRVLRAIGKTAKIFEYIILLKSIKKGLAQFSFWTNIKCFFENKHLNNLSN